MLTMWKGLPVQFSERYGYQPVRGIVQVDSVDEALRNCLWSVLDVHIWDKVQRPVYGSLFECNPEIEILCKRIWFSYFKLPLDTLKNDWRFIYEKLRAYYFGCEWFEVYDFVEFTAGNYPFGDNESFIGACNVTLKREISAYRFVDGKVTRITNEEEISAIEDATKICKEPVQIHLRRALELLADRKKPDYRNSMKESISSVESLVQDVLGVRGTLGDLTKKLESNVGIHPALGKAFNNLYGFTSDEEGIRHSILESPNVDFDDAKFLLVVCSAFVNFVAAKIKS